MNRQQRERLSQFQGITGADAGVAGRCLEASGWSVEGAIDVYYSNGMHLGASRSSGSRLDRCVLAGAHVGPRSAQRGGCCWATLAAGLGLEVAAARQLLPSPRAVWCLPAVLAGAARPPACLRTRTRTHPAMRTPRLRPQRC